MDNIVPNLRSTKNKQIAAIASMFTQRHCNFTKKVQNYIIKQKVRQNFIPTLFENESTFIFNQLILFKAQLGKNLIIFEGFQKLIDVFTNLNNEIIKIFSFCTQKWKEQYAKLTKQFNKKKQYLPQTQLCEKCKENTHFKHIEGQRNQLLNLRIMDPYYYYNEVVVENKQSNQKEQTSHKIMQTKLTQLLDGVERQHQCMKQMMQLLENQYKDINQMPQVNTNQEKLNIPVVPFIKSIYTFMKNRNHGVEKSTQTMYKLNDSSVNNDNNLIINSNGVIKTDSQFNSLDKWSKKQNLTNDKLTIKILEDKIRELQNKLDCLTKQFSELEQQNKALLDKYSNVLIQNKKLNSVNSIKLKAIHMKGHKPRASVDQISLNNDDINLKEYPQLQTWNNKMQDQISVQLPNPKRNNSLDKIKYKNNSFVMKKSSFLSNKIPENRLNNKKQSFQLDKTHEPRAQTSYQSIQRSQKTISQQIFKQLINIPQQRRQFQKSQNQISANSTNKNLANNINIVKPNIKKQQKLSININHKSINHPANHKIQRASMMPHSKIQRLPMMSDQKSIKRSFKYQEQAEQLTISNFKQHQVAEEDKRIDESKQHKKEESSKESLLRKLYENQINQNHLNEVDYHKFRQSYYQNFIKALQSKKDGRISKVLPKTFIKKKNNIQIKASIVRKETLPSRLEDEMLARQSKSSQQTQKQVKFLQQIQNNLIISCLQQQKQNLDNKVKETRQSIILFPYEINLITQIFAYMVQLKLTNINAYNKLKKIITILQHQVSIQKRRQSHLSYNNNSINNNNLFSNNNNNNNNNNNSDNLEKLLIRQNLSFLIKAHRKCKSNDKQAQPCHHIKVFIGNIIALFQN